MCVCVFRFQLANLLRELLLGLSSDAPLLCVPSSLSLSRARSLSLVLARSVAGRHNTDGNWVTYEDIVQRYAPLAPELDQVNAIPIGSISSYSCIYI